MNENNNERRPTGSSNDLGFGTSDTGNRNMNQDGSFNVERIGEPGFRPYEMYHALIRMSWGKVLLLVFICYFIFNLLFALVYYAIGTEHLSIETMGMTEQQKFLEVFFFSSQTLTTLGYGRIAPVGALASSVAAIESMIGLLGFALATGVLYGRFSRPQSKLLYSRNILVSPYREGSALMVRVTNLRKNQLIEVEVDLNVGYHDESSSKRIFVQLNLERKKINLFPTSWTIVHPIDEYSPFFGKTNEELKRMNPEIYVFIKAFDETFSQTVYSRTSYTPNEFIFGAKFIPMFSMQANGKTLLDLRMINAHQKADLAIKEM